MSKIAAHTLSALGGAALGAITVYLLDPDQGQTRRSGLFDSANTAVTGAGDAIRSTFQDSAGSAKGLANTISEYAHQLAGHLSSRASDASDQAHTVADHARDQLNTAMQSLSDRARDYAASATDRSREMAADWSDRAKSSLQRQTGWAPARSHSSIAGVATGTLGTLALGAGAMYFLDPARGHSRRAWVEEKIFSWARRGQKNVTRYGRHMANKAQGAVAQAQQSMPAEWSNAVDQAAEAAARVIHNTADAPADIK